jgi:hypothetical protein
MRSYNIIDCISITNHSFLVLPISIDIDVKSPFPTPTLIPFNIIMSDPKNPNIQSRHTPQWALYQRELFWKDNTGEVPPFSTEPGDLEDLAKRNLTIGGGYV